VPEGSTARGKKFGERGGGVTGVKGGFIKRDLKLGEGLKFLLTPRAQRGHQVQVYEDWKVRK